MSQAHQKRTSRDSRAQREAERIIRSRLTDIVGKTFHPKRFETGKSYVELDGFWSNESEEFIIVEVFAHIGRVKSAQRHKVQADVLKLATIRELLVEQGAKSVRTIYAFVCPECAKALLGKTWVGDAAIRLNIEPLIVPLDEAQRQTVLRAQEEQNLYNREERV